MRSVILLAVLLAACGGPALPDQPPPLAVYREWWAEAERCTTIQAPIERIVWRYVEGFDDSTIAGQWSSPHGIMVLRFYSQTRSVVQHEMIHDLLQMGDEAHSHPCFGSIPS